MERQYVKLAQSLPPRLTRFFARYPPPPLLKAAQPAAPITTPEQSSSSESNASSTSLPPLPDSATIPTTEVTYPNPFQPHQHPITKKWHDPVFSLRRQADLVKLARKYGVEELLPYTVKGTEERLRRREENGLRVKGTGIGQRVKGKEWERTLKGRLEKRRQAMMDMPKMIQTWKERGHGRGWKKWPK